MQISGARVLVVDDDAASRRLLEVRLRPLECDVTTAGNGEQALTAIRKDVPDLVLLDLQMPKMGGIEVLRALRKEGINVAVIVITAHGSIETAVEAMKEGAYDFITKPIDANHFDIVVRKALEREGLKRELELFSEDADKRYHLVVGKNAKMNEAVEPQRRLPRARRQSCCWERAAPERRFLPGRFTTGVIERASHLSLLTVLGYPRNFWKANCLGMKRDLSPGRTNSKRARWNWPTAERFFSTKWVMSPRSFKPSS
jgi:FixJ family two-component response regulator